MALLEFNEMSFTYKNGDHHAVQGFSCEVHEGQIILITGSSGAGKTSVCRAANGLIPHLYSGDLKGNVVVAGQYDTTQYDVASLSRIVGLLFQDADTQLFMPTVEEEIGFGAANFGVPLETIRQRTEELLDLIRLEEARSKNPHSLSGGQKQAVALASVLATDPMVLVLDEPTSNIDPIGSESVLQLIARLARDKGQTFVVVEHKLEELVHLVDHMIVMDQGKIVRSGTPSHVLEDVEAIAELGLHAPEVTLLCHRLRDIVPLESLPLTVEEAAKTLEPLLKSREERPAVSMDTRRSTRRTDGEVVIEVDHLTHEYPDGTRALEDLSLQIRRGEFVGVLGQNGSGKTTLMKHFNGLLKPTGGRVIVAGLDTRNVTIADLARHVGYIFQDPDSQIFKMKVRDEIAYGLNNLGLAKDQIEVRVREAAEELEITHLLEQNPFFLSKGEKQRVAVASVIAMKPDILVLDEPTTGQDLLRSQEIMELCVQLNESGTTVIVITHDMKLAAQYVERVVVLKDGHVLEDGPVRSVFAKTDVLQRSFLKPPQVTLLGQRLGFSETWLTVEEAEAALRRYLTEVA